jgi:hypothetical protein
MCSILVGKGVETRDEKKPYDPRTLNHFQRKRLPKLKNS